MRAVGAVGRSIGRARSWVHSSSVALQSEQARRMNGVHLTVTDRAQACAR